MLNYHICKTCQKETLWAFDACWEWDDIFCPHAKDDGLNWLKETDKPPMNCPYLLEQTLIRKKAPWRIRLRKSWEQFKAYMVTPHWWSF